MTRFSFNKISAKISAQFEPIKWKIGNKILGRHRRRHLTNRDFSIISNSCVAGGIYQKLDMPYATPTVGLFLFPDDYIEFLEKLEHYTKQSLKFKAISKYPEANERRRKSRHYYPIGVLGDDVEVHFLHYENENEANEKWTRRKERINFQNLFLIWDDKANFNEEFLCRYETLPFEHKLFLSIKDRENTGKVMFVQVSKDDPLVITRAKFEKKFNIIKWLNGEKVII
jgi:uncharacterized protein (DUF1919 family)